MNFISIRKLTKEEEAIIKTFAEFETGVKGTVNGITTTEEGL